jgi:signal transduction histidine kinase
MSTNARAGRRFLTGDSVDLQEIGEIFDDIATDGRRAADIIRGIKDMVRKSEGRREVVAINALVTDVVRLASPDAYARGCVLKTNLDPTSPTVIGDLVQLKQVLLNLVINAFDAMSQVPPDECRVEIASRLEEGGTVEVSVRDRGSGLPAEGPSRVFERFFSTKHDGMGMGLAIARSIVQAHGGTLDAEDAEGGGARFWLRIPIHAPCPGARSGVA